MVKLVESLAKLYSLIFRCDSCTEVFASNEDLLLHVESSHAFQCPQCPLLFETTSSLSSHHSKEHAATEEDGSNEMEVETYDDPVEALQGGGDYTSSIPSSSDMVVVPDSSQELAESSSPQVCPDDTTFDLDWTRFGTGDFRPQPQYPNFDLPTMEEMLEMEIVYPDPSQIAELLFDGIPAQDCYYGGARPESASEAVSSDDEEEGRDDDDDVSGQAEEEEEEFGCRRCDRVFQAKSDLSVHLLDVHPFRCPTCEKCYGVGDSLRKHCRTTHGLAVSTCGECMMAFADHEAKVAHFIEVHGTRPKSTAGASGAAANTVKVRLSA